MAYGSLFLKRKSRPFFSEHSLDHNDADNNHEDSCADRYNLSSRYYPFLLPPLIISNIMLTISNTMLDITNILYLNLPLYSLEITGVEEKMEGFAGDISTGLVVQTRPKAIHEGKHARRSSASLKTEGEDLIPKRMT